MKVATVTAEQRRNEKANTVESKTRKNKMARFPIGATLLIQQIQRQNFGSFSHLSGQILQDSGWVDCSCGSNTAMAGRSVLQVSVDTTNRELFREKIVKFRLAGNQALALWATIFDIPEVQHELNVRRLLPLLFLSPYRLYLLPVRINYDIISNVVID